MRLGGSVRLTDPADLRFRMATVTTGCWLTVAMGLAGLAYFAATWDVGHRLVLSALAIVAISSAVIVWCLPMERVVAGRWRELFFFGWTSLMVVSILALVALDPTRPSPLALPLIMPLLFAGMSYPRHIARPLAVFVPTGYLAIAFLVGEDPAYAGFFMLCLTWSAAMCLWQAANRERQREELDHQRDELARVSKVDPLTGALNRRGFEERLEAELAEAGRSGQPLTLVMLDLDNFKAVNDRQGHAAGDALLCDTVDLLVAELRPMDAVGRLGGDEFALLLPGLGRVDAQHVLDRLAGAVNAVAPASIGHSSFPVDGTGAEELYRSADEMLYTAKGARPARSRLEPLDLSWAATLADAVDRRMDVAHEHSRCVSDHAARIAQRLGWDDAQIGLLRLAGTLHDVGKVVLPDHILRKPGPLTAEEYEEIKTHSVVGASMVSRIPGMEPIAPWIRHSHEHYDGSGYPDALAADAIPMASRILLVADAFDAMTSDRSYRRAMSTDEALEELRRCAGAQFDPACVDAIAALLVSE
jgi:diguanylate cyclase (GGDEF)-like protein